MKESFKIPGTGNNNNPSDFTKQEFNHDQKFFNVINKIIKFFEDNDIIDDDDKIKMKNPMSVLNKLKTVSDSSKRNELLEKLESISNKVNKEDLDT